MYQLKILGFFPVSQLRVVLSQLLEAHHISYHSIFYFLAQIIFFICCPHTNVFPSHFLCEKWNSCFFTFSFFIVLKFSSLLHLNFEYRNLALRTYSWLLRVMHTIIGRLSFWRHIWYCISCTRSCNFLEPKLSYNRLYSTLGWRPRRTHRIALPVST